MDKNLQEILPLTEEQISALNFNLGNLLVSAGAGSGKTRVLIRRFAELVIQKKAKVTEILAITFTEKAASEMKRRLIAVFREAGQDDLRRQVEEAYVSTIHSFANRLLKEYALEIGVDPDFKVIAEDEKNALETEAWKELLDEAALSPEIYPLLLEFKSKEVLKSELINLRSVILSSAKENPWQPEESEKPLKTRQKEIVKDIQETISVMKKIGGFSKSEKEAFEKLNPSVSELSHSRPDKQILKESLSFTMRGKRSERQEFLSGAKNLIIESIIMAEDALSNENRKRMMNLIKIFDARIELKKSQCGFLDYDDLLIKLLQFLRKEGNIAHAIHRLLREKFKFILMDELQDSNSIEIEILERLSTGSNLFLVGDAKQSIYSFRQADVGIFLDRERRAETGETKLIRLQDNYRSRPEILNFVNGLFESEIFKKSEITYQPLRLPENKSEKKESIPRIECIVAHDDEEEPIKKDLRQIWEADAVAERLAELRNDPLIPNLKFGEIALLLKNFTDVSVYEQALRRKGIPYTVIAGRGFYQKCEILDIVSFLQILEDPFNDIALIGVLRSPLFNISDDALMILAEERDRLKKDKAPLWNGLWSSGFKGSLPSKDLEILSCFLTLHKKLRDQKNQLSISELIRQLVLDTSYDTKVLLEPDGKRKFANLEKMMELARGFDAKSFGFSHFLNHLSEMTVKEVREAEAQVDEKDEENVKILTVHKAKGLEFRVVVAANFDAGSQHSSSRCSYSSKWGLGVRCDFPELGSKIIGDFRYLKNKEEQSRKREEEAKRLFYVACTRAREYLILSTAPKSGENFFLEKLLQHLGCEEKTEGAYKGVWLKRALASSKKREEIKAFSEDAKIIQSLTLQKPIKSTKGSEEDWNQLYTRLSDWEFPTFSQIETSATALMNLINKAEESLKSAEKDPLLAEGDDPARIEMQAADYGTLFHSILERWTFDIKPLDTFEKIKKEIPVSIPDASRERLEKELYLFAMSPLADDLYKARRIEKELEFDWEIEEGKKIRGAIDLLYQSDKGIWNLADYKTSNIKTDKEADEKVDFYRLQLSIYASLLIEALGLEKLSCSLYFSSRGSLRSWEFSKADSELFQKKLDKLIKDYSKDKLI